MSRQTLKLAVLRAAARLHLLGARRSRSIQEYLLIRDSQFFDADWYLKKNPDVAKSGVDAAWHYCKHGWKEGRLPSLSFDGNDYLRRYPAVAKAKINPLLHWEEFGKKEGRTALSVADAREAERRKAEDARRLAEADSMPKEYAVVKESEFFDADWYLNEYPDVAAAKMDPALHYCQYGWKEGRLPSPRFDGNDYLRRYPDVAKARMNPVWHWEEYGRNESRKVKFKAGLTDEDRICLIRSSALFDETWYRQEYGIDEGVDAAEHYFTEGWSLKFNPSLHFDGNVYLDFNDGVARAKICPLYHYERYGRSEGRFIPEVNPEPCDVMIITASAITDGVYVWRLEFIREWLEANGFKVRVESVREPTNDYLSSLKAARFVIFNRAIFLKSSVSGRSVSTMRCLLSWNKRYCFDIDDLLMLQYGETLGRYKSGGIKYENLKATLFAHSNCYPLTKTMTVSTPFLADCLSRHFNLHTVLLPNTMPISRCTGKPASWTPSDKLRLLYASGSSTHLYDLSTVHLNLLNFLLRHEEATLTILGRSTGMAEFAFLGDRVTLVAYVEYDRMLEIFGEHDLLLVPLDYNETNNAKSNIKYIEAGAVGTPVIAQDCMEFRSAIRDGENGFLYSSAEDFEEKMESILKNRERLAAVGQAALEDVRKNHSTAMPLPTEFKEMICS